MPILAEHKQREKRKPTAPWVWPLAVGLVIGLGACAAGLPMVWPHAFLGEWAYDGSGRCTYFPDGRYVENSPRPAGYHWKSGRWNELYLYAPSSATPQWRETWQMRPFGMRANVTMYMGGAGQVISLHRVLHPLTDWFPFLTQ